MAAGRVIISMGALEAAGVGSLLQTSSIVIAEGGDVIGPVLHTDQTAARVPILQDMQISAQQRGPVAYGPPAYIRMCSFTLVFVQG